MLQEGKNMNNKILIFILCSLIFFTITFCSNTGPQTGTLSGTINLEGQSDHSGIIIGIYKLAELDPDIVEANQKWPHIGVIINQHTEFDHRFGTLVKTGETDAAGYFEIGNIPTGVYNVVAIKDGFGFRYIYNVQINDGETALSEQCKMNSQPVGGQVEKCIMKNDSSNSSHYSLFIEPHYSLKKERKADLLLYPETTISSDISTPTTFLSNHHYIIEQDIIVDDELTIEHGAIVRLNDGVKLTIYGDLTAVGEEDNFIWFTSNDSIFSFSVFRFPSFVSLYEYKSIELDGTFNKQVSYCKFDHAGTGLLSKVNGFEISDCVFRDSNCGFMAEYVDSTFCSNLLCENITGGSEGGIYFSHVTEGCIEKNVINDCENGIQIKNNSNPEVKNNFLKNRKYNIWILWDSLPLIHYNEFANENSYGVYNHKSFRLIQYNNFHNYIGVLYNECHPEVSEIHNNNFFCSLYAIKIRNTVYQTADINAENNYFGTVDITEIQNLIWDKNDLDENDPTYPHTGIVNFTPFLLSEVISAGIQGE